MLYDHRLTLSDAARRLWLSDATCLQWCKRGDLEHSLLPDIQHIPRPEWYQHPEYIRIHPREIHLLLHGGDCVVCGAHVRKQDLIRLVQNGWEEFVCRECYDRCPTCDECNDPILASEDLVDDGVFQVHRWCAEEE